MSRLALRRAAEDDTVKIAAITGNGNYFSSGNDLSNFLQAQVGILKHVKRMHVLKEKHSKIIPRNRMGLQLACCDFRSFCGFFFLFA